MDNNLLIPRVQRNIGFIGSIKGMTLPQIQSVARFLSAHEFGKVSHCDYTGACHQFHLMIRQSYPTVNVVLYPTTSDRHRAHCPADIYKDPVSYEHRNRRFIFETSVVLVAPAQEFYPPFLSQPRPHRPPQANIVWDIIDYAQVVKRPYVVFWPSGTISTPWKKLGEE